MTPKISTRVFGSGPLPVLAIHCSLGHAGAWRGIGEALSDLATLHAFDLPGHGQSADWDGQTDLHQIAADMALTVLEGLGPDPIDVIGHSFGAVIALHLAIHHPHRVRRLVMFEPVFFAAAMADDPDFAPTYLSATADFDSALDARDFETAARTFTAVWGDGTLWDAIPAPTRAYMVARIGFVRLSAPFLVQDCAGLLAPGQFEGAKMPALVLRGASSDWTEAINGAIARRLPKAAQITLPDMTHMGPITHPEAVGAALRTFLSGD